MTTLITNLAALQCEAHSLALDHMITIYLPVFTHVIGDESISGVESDVFQGSPLILGKKLRRTEEIPAEISAVTEAQLVPITALVNLFHVA